MRNSSQHLTGDATTLYEITIRFLRTYKQILVGLLIISIVMFIVIMSNFSGEDFAKFTYPQEIKNFDRFIYKIDTRNEQAKHGAPANLTNIFQEIIDSTSPNGTLNGEKIVPYTQFSNLNFLINPRDNCSSWLGNDNSSQFSSSPISVIIVVKSAVNNYINRETIRKTWAINGRVDLFQFKTVFIVGACDRINPVPNAVYERNNGVWTPEDCRRTIGDEAQVHGDLLQSSALDSYYNLTMKTAMMLRWVSDDCPSDFFLVLDDDYAFEVTNLIRWIEFFATNSLRLKSRSDNEHINIRDDLKKLAHKHLYAGYLRDSAAPIRANFDKFRISYGEYPFNRYPPFITGGQVLMSHKTVRSFYLASHFVQSIKFEDVYMGIMAYKLGVKAIHGDHFMCLPRDYLASKPFNPNSTDCIGVHEIKQADLIDLWDRRRQLRPTLLI